MVRQLARGDNPMEHLQDHWSSPSQVDLEYPAPPMPAHHRGRAGGEHPQPPQPQVLDVNGVLPYEVISTQFSSMVLDASPTPSKIPRAQAPPCPDLEDAFASSARISKVKEFEVQSDGVGWFQNDWAAPPLRRKKASSRPTYTFDSCLVPGKSRVSPGSRVNQNALPPAIIKHIEDSTSRALVLYKPPSSIIAECVPDRSSKTEESDEEGTTSETMEID
ncbi:hypothetical protein TCAL_12628 [Tigriopus californicus]|uniref:Uncharacterized protein n=1 Tax=Tigriopus californicus TaxID=6832 RepID=A0A553NYM5_TIGCA|nr:uncharacterized protein LOC131887468 [Tigriopus californicus]XP_059092071.1 uncharacterized protein LOC131887468 [Tigriopus californicus]TRY70536.1 hypothetical protein TCAL_12628 [Tigriopus californicus]|eukprot:TCALIF_12628-PA protein Name:"Protein of unknown function" AED:0.00 eAED:0.00 QI:92/1/1/1/1/1/3/135/218